jgi:hypothetical protein
MQGIVLQVLALDCCDSRVHSVPVIEAATKESVVLH